MVSLLVVHGAESQNLYRGRKLGICEFIMRYHSLLWRLNFFWNLRFPKFLINMSLYKRRLKGRTGCGSFCLPTATAADEAVDGRDEEDIFSIQVYSRLMTLIWSRRRRACTPVANASSSLLFFYSFRLFSFCCRLLRLSQKCCHVCVCGKINSFLHEKQPYSFVGLMEYFP